MYLTNLFIVDFMKLVTMLIGLMRSMGRFSSSISTPLISHIFPPLFKKKLDELGCNHNDSFTSLNKIKNLRLFIFIFFIICVFY